MQYRADIIPSSYAPGGVPVVETLGGPVITADDLLRAGLSFGKSLLTTTLEKPEAQAVAIDIGTQAAGAAEKSAMSAGFEKAYAFWTAHRVPIVVGIVSVVALTASGIVWKIARATKRR